MPQFATGYYKIHKQGIEIDKYYVLSLKNLRKPSLLRFSCKTSMLAKRYIMTYPNPELFEIIKGDMALERNIPLSRKTVGKNLPCKYSYPPHVSDKKKRKQYRTGYRDRLRKAYIASKELRQFTIRYKGITYTTFNFTFEKAIMMLNKECKIKWDFFIRKVDMKPQPTKGLFFIKPYYISFESINQFQKLNNVHTSKHTPTRGTISRLTRSFLQVQKPKPQSLLL